MAVHTGFPPSGAEALVRGDPATMVVRFRVGGVDQDISTWTFRSFVRNRFDGDIISQCETFEVHAADDMGDLFPGEPGATPAVLLLRWSTEQTQTWQSGYVCDIEQMTPNKRTWIIFDQLRIDKDVSYETGSP
jgi:hypothetical protein